MCSIASGSSAQNASRTKGTSRMSSVYPGCGEMLAATHFFESERALSFAGRRRSSLKSCSDVIRFSGGQCDASSNVSAMRKSRYEIITSRRVGSGRTGIDSAKVRLVFSRRSSRVAISRARSRREKAGWRISRPSRARNRPGERRDRLAERAAAHGDAPPHPEERGDRSRVPKSSRRDRRPADAALGVHTTGKIPRQILVRCVADRSKNHVGNARLGAGPCPRRRLHVDDGRATRLGGARFRAAWAARTASADFWTAVRAGVTTERRVPGRIPGSATARARSSGSGGGRLLDRVQHAFGGHEVAGRELRRKPSRHAGAQRRETDGRRRSRPARRETARTEPSPVSTTCTRPRASTCTCAAARARAIGRRSSGIAVRTRSPPVSSTDIAVGPEPGDRARERLFDPRLRESRARAPRAKRRSTCGAWTCARSRATRAGACAVTRESAVSAAA